MKSKSRAKKGVSVGEQARSILRILIAEAGQADRWITYGELARRTGIANCAFRVPMDHLSETLNEYAATRRKRIPPIQVMIVNGKTGVPGPGAARHIGKPYLQGTSYDKLGVAEQNSIASRIRSDITAYSGWKTIERDLGLLL
jgi:hypothetical protein